MRQLLLATVATAALTFPAAAADQLQQSDNTQTQRSSTNSEMTSANQQQASRDISHEWLSSLEIRSIQQALIDKGYEPGAVDGMWGNLTRAAVWNFQQKNGIDPSGEVDPQTLSALGVTLAGQDQATVDTGSSTVGSGSTTGSATTGSGAGMDDAMPAGKQSQK